MDIKSFIRKLMNSKGRNKDEGKDEDDKQVGSTDDILAKLESDENPSSAMLMEDIEDDEDRFGLRCVNCDR